MSLSLVGAGSPRPKNITEWQGADETPKWHRHLARAEAFAKMHATKTGSPFRGSVASYHSGAGEWRKSAAADKGTAIES